MTIDELRLGNWVNHSFMDEDELISVNGMVISLVYPSQMEIHTSPIELLIDGYDILSYDLNEIQGIPLTKEMLEPMGFTFNTKTQHWVYEFTNEAGSRRSFWIGEDEKDGLFYAVHDLLTFDSVALHLIPFVHNLQNSFYEAVRQKLEVKL